MQGVGRLYLCRCPETRYHRGFTRFALEWEVESYLQGCECECLVGCRGGGGDGGR